MPPTRLSGPTTSGQSLSPVPKYLKDLVELGFQLEIRLALNDDALEGLLEGLDLGLGLLTQLGDALVLPLAPQPLLLRLVDLKPPQNPFRSGVPPPRPPPSPFPSSPTSKHFLPGSIPPLLGMKIPVLCT